jgi:hypothetical protein
MRNINTECVTDMKSNFQSGGDTTGGGKDPLQGGTVSLEMIIMSGYPLTIN